MAAGSQGAAVGARGQPGCDRMELWNPTLKQCLRGLPEQGLRRLGARRSEDRVNEIQTQISWADRDANWPSKTTSTSAAGSY